MTAQFTAEQAAQLRQWLVTCAHALDDHTD
jgi:hypothetical protein